MLHSCVIAVNLVHHPCVITVTSKVPIAASNQPQHWQGKKHLQGELSRPAGPMSSQSWEDRLPAATTRNEEQQAPPTAPACQESGARLGGMPRNTWRGPMDPSSAAVPVLSELYWCQPLSFSWEGILGPWQQLQAGPRPTKGQMQNAYRRWWYVSLLGGVLVPFSS